MVAIAIKKYKHKNGCVSEYARLIKSVTVDGKQKKILIKNLGIVGQDLNRSDFFEIKNTYKSANINTKKRNLLEVYNEFLPIFKKDQINEFYFKAKAIHKCNKLKNFEILVDSGGYKLSNYIEFVSLSKKILASLGHLNVNDIDVFHIKNLNNELLNRHGISINSIKNYYSAIKKMLNYSVQKKYLKTLPDFPKIKKNNTSVSVQDTLSESEIEQLYLFANKRQAFVLDVFLETALRPEEFANFYLKGGLVTPNFENKTVVIDSFRDKKKGGVIPMSEKLVEVLQYAIDSGLIKNKINPYSTLKDCRVSFKNLCKKAGIFKEKITLRLLRKTKITLMLKCGVPEIIITKFARHSALVMGNYYTGNLTEDMRKYL